MTTLADLLLYGDRFGPDRPTPRTRAGLPEGQMGVGPRSMGEQALDIAEAPARGVVGQAQRAGQSVSDAIGDPSLANVTDAVVQSGLALTPVSPRAGLAAVGGGGLGLLESVRRDYAPDIMGGEALAQSKSKKKPPVTEEVAPPPEDDPLDPSQRKRLTELQRKQAKGESLSRAEREEQNTYLATLSEAAKIKLTAKTAAEGDTKKAALDAEKKQRETADAAYESEKARDLRFQNTETGKVFAKLGPVAPGVVAAAVGAGAQLPRSLGWAPTGAMNVATHPITKGTTAGIAAAHWPQVYDAAYAPAMNPSYAAMQSYVAEAPPGDERAARYRKLLEDKVVGKENPVRDVASKDLYDLTKFGERSLIGAAEGVTGGPLGAAVVKSFPGLVRGAASMPGMIREGYNRGMEGGAKAAEALHSAEGLAALKRADALEAQAVAAEAQRRIGGQKVGAVQALPPPGSPPGAPPVAPPPAPAAAANPPPALLPPAAPAVNAGTVKAISPPRKTVTKEDTDQILKNLVAGKPAGEGLSGYSPQAIADRADYLQKLAGSLGTPIDRLLVAGQLKKGPWSVAIGGAVGAGAALEDDTSPTGFRDESGRFAKSKSLDDAIDKAMGGAP